MISPDGRRAGVTPARLRAMPAFATIDEGQLTDLAARFGSEHHAAGATIVEQGEQGDKLYVIVRGTLDVTQRGPDGAEHPLPALQDGDFFGEIALLDNVPRTATVRARTACLLLVLSRSEFQDVVRTSPELRALFEHTAQARLPGSAARLTTREPSA